MFFKKGVLKNFAVFTEKHLCWSLFLIKLQAFRASKFLRRAFLQNTIPRHKGHKWLNKICKLMFIEADSYTLIIYHVV